MNNMEDALPLPLQLVPDPPLTISSEAAPPSLAFPIALPRFDTYGPQSSFMPASYLRSSFGYTAEPMSYDEDSISSDPHPSMPLLCSDSDPYRGDLEFKDEEKEEEYDDDPVIYISDECMYIFLYIFTFYKSVHFRFLDLILSKCTNI